MSLVAGRFRSVERCFGLGHTAFVVSGASRAMDRTWMGRNVLDKFEGWCILFLFDKVFMVHTHLICRDVEMRCI